MKFPSIIGVIHLPALAGAPGAQGSHPAQSLQMAGIIAVKEAKTLAQAGFEGIILENFGDIPFYKSEVPPETVASMAVIAAAVRESVRIPIGINVLRNDARAALAIAAVTACDFIRVNVLSGVSATDQGMIEGNAAELIREKHRLGAAIGIFADAHVKHARSLSSDDLGLSIEELSQRSWADAVIISGQTTGRLATTSQLRQASEAALRMKVPLYAGSGVALENLAEVRSFLDGIIVSSALRQGGLAGRPLDARRLRAFVQTFRRIRLKTRKRKSTR